MQPPMNAERQDHFAATRLASLPCSAGREAPNGCNDSAYICGYLGLVSFSVGRSAASRASSKITPTTGYISLTWR